MILLTFADLRQMNESTITRPETQKKRYPARNRANSLYPPACLTGIHHRRPQTLCQL
jgi:hypothetical protein